MPPGKEDEEEFAQDVGGCDVEVVFQGADGDVAVDLCKSCFSSLTGLVAVTWSVYLHSAPCNPARPSPRSCPLGTPSAPSDRS